LLAFVFGVVFVTALLTLAVLFSEPTPFQYTVFRIVLALAAAGVAAVIPGILNVKLSFGVRAGGALAVFVIVYFFSPAALTDVTVRTPREIETGKLIVPQPADAGRANDLLVTDAKALLVPGALAKRFNNVVIRGVKAEVPDNATLVANEIRGENAGMLTGRSFSVVSRRLNNLVLDVSARAAATEGGSVFLYVKQVENSNVLARGFDGAPGTNGNNGARGSDGSNGEDGRCGPFGDFRGSTGGGDGGDGTPGTDGTDGTAGSNGRRVVLTTIVEPSSFAVDVKGGAGGSGGKGGKGGEGGRGGRGGSGCSGLGGHQPDRSGGRNGVRGADGKDGLPGQNGRAGEYRLVVLEAFDKIMKVLSSDPNNGNLHERLQREL
jgi:hypothetical protein